MLSRSVAERIRAKKDDNYPFLKISQFLKSADVVFANLETPITPGRAIRRDEMVFRTDPGMEKAMKRANISAVSLANNHTMNFGVKGLADTITYLDRAGVKHAGGGSSDADADRPAIIMSNGIRIAFLAYADPAFTPRSYFSGPQRVGVSLMDIGKMQAAVKSARHDADVVVVSMHAGIEYQALPNRVQQNFARAAIDAGADIVIGHHPHVVQTVEKYHGTYIIYSLGNFIFDQMWSRETRQGMVASIMISKKGVTSVSFTPVLIEDNAQPRILTGTEAKTVLARLKLPNT